MCRYESYLYDTKAAIFWRVEKTLFSGLSVASFVMAVPVLFLVVQMAFVKNRAMLSHVQSTNHQCLPTLIWKTNQTGSVMEAARLKSPLVNFIILGKFNRF